MPLAFSSAYDEFPTPIPSSETTSPLSWPLVPARSAATASNCQVFPVKIVGEHDNVQLYPNSLTRTRELSARSSTTFDTTRSSSVPRRPQDWFSQLPAKVRRAQFSPSEQARIQQSNSLSSLTNYQMHTSNESIHQLRTSASTSACSSNSVEHSDVTASTNFSPRLSVETTHGRVAYKSSHPSCTDNNTKPTGGFMTSPASRSGDNPRPSLSLRPRKTSASELFTPTSPTYRRTPPRYLHDPETQLKLKLYSGSKEKFDEVLVYGFPSTNEPETTTPDPPKPTRPQANLRAKMTAISDYQKALKNDSLAFLDDSDDDEYDYYDDEDDYEDHVNDFAELEDVEYAYDPGLPACRSRRSKADLFSDYDNYVSTIPSPLPPLTEDPYSQARPFSAGRFFGLDRDSTLRITLTKPEIRAAAAQSIIDPDDITQGFHYVESSAQDAAIDLLALEPLEILPDHAAIALLSKQKSRSSLSKQREIMRKNMLTITKTQTKPKSKSSIGSAWLCW